MNDLFSAVQISLIVSLSATFICSIIGIPLGCAAAINEFTGKKIILSLLTSLLALPTVVVGLIVYTFIRRSGPLGELGMLFTPSAMVIGEVVLAMPITIIFTYSACSSVDKAARDTARTLGAGSLELSAAVISEARYGIMAAVAATFGRLIGEVGIAMMLGGNIAGFTRTMTTTIALETSKGEFNPGMKLGLILMAIALIVNVLLRWLQERSLRWSNK